MPNDNVLTPERRFHFANRMIHIDSLEDRIALVRTIERAVLAAHTGQPEPRAEVTDDDKADAARWRHFYSGHYIICKVYADGAVKNLGGGYV
ncbi:TPA: hypothetical protein QDA94_000430, partial [Burkholderia vietnamiensis]|nr:hypothetical protein [Burkholderia vietnamiensis]HDR9230463.1 hypothetical protein [Burkholderia vietnamiensis]